MFISSNMTDAELIRATSGTESPVIRELSHRLTLHADTMAKIHRESDIDAYAPPDSDSMLDRLCTINELASPKR
jgi:hypothetical protein